jgi:hypothetical protein
VDADGSAPLSYQWYFNTNTPIQDATNSALTLTSVQASDAGSYSVIITNSIGAITSSFAFLNVALPIAPSITDQPLDQTVLPGAADQHAGTQCQ